MKMVARLERMAFPRVYRVLSGTLFAWCFFLTVSSAKAEPSYGEVLAGVMQSLSGGTSVIEMQFEAYPSGEFEGRVNVARSPKRNAI